MPPESVPTEAVIIFLDDKGAVPISQALERLLYREELRTLTRSKFIDVIDSVIANIDVPASTVPSAPIEVPPVVQSEVAQEVVPEVMKEEELVQDEAPEVITDVAPLVSSNARAEKFLTMLDDGTRERIIRKLFNKDAESFSAIVDEVLSCVNWKEAAGIVDRFYARQGMAPDSTAAMEFSQALHRSFL